MVIWHLFLTSNTDGDRLCYAYAKSFDVEVTIVRLFNIYGPRQEAGKSGAVILTFGRKVMAGEVPVIFATGEQTPDYLYISNLVEVSKLVVNTEGLADEVINFGSRKEMSIKYLAEAVCQRINPDIAPEFTEKRVREASSFCAIIKEAGDLDWKP